MFKRRLSVRFAAGFLLLAGATAVMAQQPNLDFYRITFTKSKPNKATEYEAFLKQNLLPVEQAAIHPGGMRVWALNRVWVPTGAEADHNFIQIFAYEKWADMEPAADTPAPILAAFKKLGFATPAAYTEKASALGESVNSRIIHRVAGSERTPQATPKVDDWVVINYLKTDPGKAQTFVNAWKASLPVSEELIKQGREKFVSLWAVMGSGEADEFNFIRFLGYSSFKDISNPDVPTRADIAEKLFPGKGQQMDTDLSSSRHLVRQEIVRIRLRTEQ
jgi:hypothetical protein